MEKKNKLKVTKTFEEFKADNAMHYNYVLNVFKQINSWITNAPIRNRNMRGTVLAEPWEIEGSLNLSDLRTEEDTKDYELFFIQKNMGESIHVDLSAQGRLVRQDPGDYHTPPHSESDQEISIQSITYYKNDGADEFTIRVDPVMEQILEQIINKIST